MSGAITDDDIEAAIEQHDDPDHPDATTVGDVRDILESIQTGLDGAWDGLCDEVESGSALLVHESDGSVVLASSGQELAVGLNDAGVHDDITRQVVRTAHENAARRLTDYSWGSAHALVADKPTRHDASRRLHDAHLCWLTDECGLSVGVATDYLMTEWRGLSQSAWARRAGKDQGTVSQNVSKATDAVVR